MVVIYLDDEVQVVHQGDKLWINTKRGCLLRIQGLEQGNAIVGGGQNDQGGSMHDILILPKKQPSEEIKKIQARLDECMKAWEELCPCEEIKKIQARLDECMKAWEELCPCEENLGIIIDEEVDEDAPLPEHEDLDKDTFLQAIRRGKDEHPPTP